MKAREHVN